MKTISTILAATIALATVAPAHAQVANDKRLTASYDSARRTYCVHTTQLGSRIVSAEVKQKNCRTEKQWADAGFTFTRGQNVQLAQR